MNRQLAEESDPTLAANSGSNAPPPQRLFKKPQLSCSLVTRVSTKLEEGDFRGAVRLVCSEDSVAEHNDATIAALLAKHPSSHPDTEFPAPPQENGLQPLVVTERDVAQAIRSFPKGLAGGLDRLQPQHLKDLISNTEGFWGEEIANSTHFLHQPRAIWEYTYTSTAPFLELP